MKVLIVEDNEDSRNLLMKQLQAHGQEVIAAANGVEALEQALKQPTDIIISDILMPKMDGFQLCMECKRDDELKAIPFIFYTATYTDEKDEELALKLGASKFIRKPIEPEQFMNLMRDAIQKVDAGKVVLPKPVAEEGIIKFYNERLVKKLEKKMLELEKEVAERKKAEETLRHSEQNFRDLFENAVAGIYQTTQEGRILTANEAFAKMYGYNSAAEIISEITDIATQLYANKEDRDEIIRIAAKQGSVESREVKMRQRNGNTFWVSLSLCGFTDDSSKLLQIEGVCVDITERKQAEEKLQQSYQKLKKTVESTIQTIALTSETRDPYTAGHQRRVAKLASAIAEEIGLSPEKIEGLHVAGILHDIGKIHVPSEILSKPGKLSKEEMSIIKIHPEIGRDILKTLELPWKICPIVLQHHERMDGSGYPYGLLGKDIIIEARILAVADVVEAMASHRPYRPALGLDKALEELAKNKGKFYDPDVVDACLKLFNEKGFKL